MSLAEGPAHGIARPNLRTRALRPVSALLLVAAAALVWTSSTSAAGVTAGVGNRTLTVSGDGSDQQITLGLNVAGNSVEVSDNGSSVGTFALSDIDVVYVAAGPGNDTITVDESNGVLPDAITIVLRGGPG